VQATADGPSFPAAGGSGSIRIGTTRDCQWAVKTDASWVTVAQPSEGQGEGSVRFSVTANDDPASRTAGITINDQRVDLCLEESCARALRAAFHFDSDVKAAKDAFQYADFLPIAGHHHRFERHTTIVDATVTHSKVTKVMNHLGSMLARVCKQVSEWRCVFEAGF